ncbi:hypothetical protein D3C84_727830 [compost metagenome]
MEAHAGESGGDLFFEVQVAQFDRRRHFAEGQVGVETVVDLTQLQAAGDVALEAQLAAGGGNVQQLAADRCLELFTVQINVDQLRQFQGSTECIAPLVIDDLIGQGATVATAAVGFVDGQQAIAFPCDAHAFMKSFDLERFAGQQEAFAISGNHFVQGNHVAFTIQVHQITLEALAALVERDDQRVMAV